MGKQTAIYTKQTMILPAPNFEKKQIGLLPILLALFGAISMLNLAFLIVLSSRIGTPEAETSPMQAAKQTDLSLIHLEVKRIRKELDEMKLNVSRELATMRKLDAAVGSLNTAIVQLRPELGPDAQSHSVQDAE